MVLGARWGEISLRGSETQRNETIKLSWNITIKYRSNMKIEKFDDLAGQFSQYGLVVAPQFRTNVLSQSLNGSVVATVSTSGEKKVYVGIKYPESFIKRIPDLHSFLVVGKVDTNMDLTIYQ